MHALIGFLLFLGEHASESFPERLPGDPVAAQLDEPDDRDADEGEEESEQRNDPIELALGLQRLTLQLPPAHVAVALVVRVARHTRTPLYVLFVV